MAATKQCAYPESTTRPKGPRYSLCHPDRSDPAFSCARFVCAGSRSGGIAAKSQPMLSGLPLRASALVFLCEPLRTLHLSVIFFLSSLASSLSRRRSNISYASCRTWRDRQTSSQQSAPDPCPFEAGESSPCCRREPSVSLDQISRDRVSSEQPQSQVP